MLFSYLSFPKSAELGDSNHSVSLTMKKSTFLLPVVLVASLLLCVSQPAYGADQEGNSVKAGSGTSSQSVVTKAKTKKPTTKTTKSKNTKKKNTDAISSKGKSDQGRCNKPDDLDAKGKRCGNRAASVRKGGN
jgi:hypothetical protein